MKTNINLLLKTRLNPVILSAGMQRSGSTLLYNILRLSLYEKYKGDLATCWIGDIDELSCRKMNLIKVHELDRLITFRASHVFYTYRDVRDAMVSNHIKFNTAYSLENCNYLIEQYKNARKYADLMISYEDISQNTESQIEKIANILRLDIIPANILRNIPKITPERDRSKAYDKRTQMHGGHSSGMKPGEWRTVFSEELKSQISEKFDWWFQETNYELD